MLMLLMTLLLLDYFFALAISVTINYAKFIVLNFKAKL